LLVSDFLANRSACNPTPKDLIGKAVVAILILSQQPFSDQLLQSGIKDFT